jgi:glucarate dehydratase
MRIKRVTVTPIAFKDPPLLNASGIHEPYALRSIIEVEADNGLVGLGESYGDAPALAILDRVKPTLVGVDPFDLNALRARVIATLATIAPSASPGAELAPGSHASKAVANAYSAFEVALLDLQARHLGAPLVDLLGGAVRRRIPFSAYLFFKYAEHIDSPYPADRWGEALTEAQIVEQARRMIAQYGFGSIKLKAGALDPEHEVACLKALKRAFPDRPLRIDPNGNWSLETAMRMAGLLAGDLEYYEDPTPGLEGMAELHRRTGLPLATNMVVTDFDEFRRSIALGSVQIVLSDHHYWGGLRDTQVLARMCGIFGLAVDAFELASGHQPDGDVARGGIGPERGVCARHALPVAGRRRRSPRGRQVTDRRRYRADRHGPRSWDRDRPGKASQPSRVVSRVRHSPARRREADAPVQARLECGQAAVLMA